MTRIKLAGQISGTRNGADWPKPGSVIDLPEDEARDLIAGGIASETDEKTTTDPADVRGAEPWESVGVATHDYPDATGRTGPPLTEVPEQLAVNNVAKPIIENPPLPSETNDNPKVPEDARSDSPLDAQGKTVSVESASVAPKENAATRTTKTSGKRV